jgi:hypothetical protein
LLFRSLAGLRHRSTRRANNVIIGGLIGPGDRDAIYKRLREPVASGEVTCSIRIWQRPHVKIGGRYRLGAGAIEVTSIRQIELSDITPALARRSGFAGVVDLLKIAKHGPGENIYLVEFTYIED